MGAFLEKPKREKTINKGSYRDMSYAIASMQGWRIEMEDKHIVDTFLPGKLSDWAFFGVFDGHAGAKTSEYCSQHLIQHILQTNEFKKLAQDCDLHSDQDLIRDGIVNGFLTFDEELQTLDDKSGSTAITCFVTPQFVIFANCGDSRAILVAKNGTKHATLDHKPTNAIERQRISDAGGSIMLGRVNGALAVSRSLGDFDYKKSAALKRVDQIVSPEPDVTFHTRDKIADQLLILACDGIWDVYDNDNLAQYLLHRVKCKNELSDVASELLDTCLSKGSKDNMSVLLVAFPSAPKCDAEMRQNDEKLDKQIRETVQLIVKNNNVKDSQEFYNGVLQKEFSNYPPGGIITKQGLIDEVLSTCWSTGNNNESRVNEE